MQRANDHLWLVVLAYAAIAMNAAALAAPATDSFDRRIAPILAAHCLECHRGPEPEGELDLSRSATAFQGGESGPAIVAHDLKQSLIWQRIEADEMPPEHPMPPAEKMVLRE